MDNNAKATIVAAMIAALAAIIASVIAAATSIRVVKLQIESVKQEEQFQKELVEQVSGFHSEVSGLQSEVAELQSEISLLRNRPDGTVFHSGHMYWLSDDPCSWATAVERCEQKGGHLVTVTTEEEREFISALIQTGTKPFYWLGASDEEQEDNWTWVTGETWNDNIAQWAGNQPDNSGGNEHYLEVDRATGKWNDLQKDGPLTIYINGEDFVKSQPRPDIGYICEWD